ncbi:MAG: acyl-CoA dehydrogenase family protein [Candidatus Limnocylindria bacterium]
MAVATGRTVKSVQSAIDSIASPWGRERAERQQRRELRPAEFADLAETGFLSLVVPTEHGGLWAGEAVSTRPVCEALRRLARADSSVALVSSMHPTVIYLSFLAPQAAPPGTEQGWEAQRREAFTSALAGAWWGTIASEPGSGGDVAKTKAVARPGPDGRHRVSGMKHFGSGWGITSFMITTALPAGASSPEIFYVDVRGALRDGSAGITLVAPWDGHGMIATQSHAIRFDEYPATLVGWPGYLEQRLKQAGPFLSTAFSAVIVGVVDAAMEAARASLGPKSAGLRAFEQVEWSQANVEAWLIQQAYEGMLRAMESGGGRGTLEGKTAIASLAESLTGRLCRVVGGATFGRGSPFGHWAEDVRALGFLRPPWGLAYDRLFEQSWNS